MKSNDPTLWHILKRVDVGRAGVMHWRARMVLIVLSVFMLSVLALKLINQ